MLNFPCLTCWSICMENQSEFHLIKARRMSLGWQKVHTYLNLTPSIVQETAAVSKSAVKEEQCLYI